MLRRRRPDTPRPSLTYLVCDELCIFLPIWCVCVCICETIVFHSYNRSAILFCSVSRIFFLLNTFAGRPGERISSRRYWKFWRFPPPPRPEHYCSSPHTLYRFNRLDSWLVERERFPILIVSIHCTLFFFFCYPRCITPTCCCCYIFRVVTAHSCCYSLFF